MGWQNFNIDNLLYCQGIFYVKIVSDIVDHLNSATDSLKTTGMSNKKIENWKGQVAKGKTIFVATKVKTIHPVVDAIVKNLCEIDLIQYVRISQEDIQASNEIKIKGRIKIPISTTGHPSAVGVHLILDFAPNTIQFHEITSAVNGIW